MRIPHLTSRYGVLCIYVRLISGEELQKHLHALQFLFSFFMSIPLSFFLNAPWSWYGCAKLLLRIVKMTECYDQHTLSSDIFQTTLSSCCFHKEISRCMRWLVSLHPADLFTRRVANHALKTEPRACIEVWMVSIDTRAACRPNEIFKRSSLIPLPPLSSLSAEGTVKHRFRNTRSGVGDVLL